jgi:hypothetical protein
MGRFFRNEPRIARFLRPVAESADRLEQQHANVKHWATEQWDGALLPGNINPRETHIERSDLDAWRSGGGSTVLSNLAKPTRPRP